MNAPAGLELELANAARRWVAAYMTLEVHVDRAQLQAAVAELDAATHDLVLAAGVPCPFCDPDTCPGGVLLELPSRRIEDTAPL